MKKHRLAKEELYISAVLVRTSNFLCVLTTILFASVLFLLASPIFSEQQKHLSEDGILYLFDIMIVAATLSIVFEKAALRLKHPR